MGESGGERGQVEQGLWVEERTISGVSGTQSPRPHLGWGRQLWERYSRGGAGEGSTVCLGPRDVAGPARPGCRARCEGVGLLRAEGPWGPRTRWEIWPHQG